MSFFTHSGFAMSVLLAFSSQGAWAHDPAEHARAAAETKATAKSESQHMHKDGMKMGDMKGMPMKMDHSSMPMNKPVAK